MRRIVVLYSGGRQWGGIETYLLNLFRLYDRRRMALVLASMGEWGLTEALRGEGLSSQVRVLSPRRARPRTVHDLRRLLREESAHLLVSQGVVANAYARLAVVGADVPSLVVVHSDMAADYPARTVHWTYVASDRALRPVTEHYIAVCEHLKKRLVESGIKAERVRVIHNGVSPAGRTRAAGDSGAGQTAATDARGATAAARAAQAAGGRLTAVGRLHPVKNFDGLIAAMRLLPPETRLSIWGEGPDRARLSALIARLGLGERVALCGESKTMSQALAGADIYVQPSKSEGCSFTVAEAMLHGMPVVVTPCGGLPEQVEDGVSGVVASDSSPEGLAAAISTLLRDRDLAARLAVAGKKAAEAAHAVDSWIEKTTTAFIEAARGSTTAQFGGQSAASS